MIPHLFAGIGRRIALWAALGAAILVAVRALILHGRHQAKAELAIRQADARIRAMNTARETRNDVQDADRADLERRAERWMRDARPPSSK